MLHAIILAVAKESAETIARIAQQSGHIKIDCIFREVESARELVRRLNSLSPDLVLVEMGDAANASLCGLIREKAPHAAMVGFFTGEPGLVDPQWPEAQNQDCPAEPWPLTPQELLRSARHAMVLKHPGQLPNIVAMLPAKAGCGASTTVLNVAGQLGESFQRKVLVVEADLRSGALSEALNITCECSLAQTLADSDMLDSLLWSQQIGEIGAVHLMPSRRETSGALPQWYDYSRLLRFAASRYEQIIVDLPEVINDATAEVVRLARAVYIVTTPELPALQLARSRISELDQVLNDAGPVRIILNRWRRGDVHPRDVGSALEREVEAVLPNDYLSVKKAILRNSYVESKTALGAAYHALAGFLIGEMPPPLAEEPKSKLLSAFVPAHFQIGRRSA